MHSVKDLFYGITINKIEGSFNCSDNQLTSLDGSPTEVGGHFYCGDNEKQFTEEDVQKVCNVKGEIHI